MGQQFAFVGFSQQYALLPLADAVTLGMLAEVNPYIEAAVLGGLVLFRPRTRSHNTAFHASNPRDSR